MARNLKYNGIGILRPPKLCGSERVYDSSRCTVDWRRQAELPDLDGKPQPCRVFPVLDNILSNAQIFRWIKSCVTGIFPYCDLTGFPSPICSLEKFLFRPLPVCEKKFHPV